MAEKTIKQSIQHDYEKVTRRLTTGCLQTVRRVSKVFCQMTKVSYL